MIISFTAWGVFFCGMVSTLILEVAAVLIGAAVSASKRRRYKKEREKRNS